MPCRRRKCDVCSGKGGWHEMTLFGFMWRPCLQCMGKGSWWLNKRKSRSAARGRSK